MKRKPSCVIRGIGAVKRIKHKNRIIFLNRLMSQDPDQADTGAILCPETPDLLYDFSFHMFIYFA
jgi:hypothetical protein